MKYCEESAPCEVAATMRSNTRLSLAGSIPCNYSNLFTIHTRATIEWQPDMYVVGGLTTLYIMHIDNVPRVLSRTFGGGGGGDCLEVLYPNTV